MAWAPPPRLAVSDWADSRRVLAGDYASEPGPWRTDRVPYLRGIMDAFGARDVQEVTVVAGTQVGKTEALLNCLGYAAECDPGPAMVVQATEDAFKRFVPRLHSLVQDTPQLRARLVSPPEKLECLLAGSPILSAWAGSPAMLATMPIRYLFLDETDKYPARSGKEANPIKLARERTRTFTWTKKVVKVSTPTTKDGYIWREYASSRKHRLYVTCPRCGAWQALLWKNVRFGTDDEIRERIRELRHEADNLVHYDCAGCHAELHEVDRLAMLRTCRWVPESLCSLDVFPGEPPEQLEMVSHMGFHLPSLYSPWVSWAEMAAEWITSHGNETDLMNFINSLLAEPWVVARDLPVPAQITACIDTDRDPVPPGTGPLPEGAIAVSAGVDVQRTYVVFVIRAWGPGNSSWLIFHGLLPRTHEGRALTFLDDVLMTTYGAYEPVAFIDARYEPDDVYDYAQRVDPKGRRIVPAFGTGEREMLNMPPVVEGSAARSKTKTTRRSPYEGATVRVNSSLFRHWVHDHIKIQRDAPQQWRLHAGVANDPEYGSQILGEYYNATRKQWVRTGPNHYLDAEALCRAAAWYLSRVQQGEIDTKRVKAGRGAGSWASRRRYRG